MMLNLSGSSKFVRRSLVLTAVLGASVAAMSAQTVAAPAARPDLSFVSDNPLAFSSSTSTSLDQGVAQDNSANVAAVVKDPLKLDAMQYNGRPRYQRPRYRGQNTNPDGSNKYMFYGGFGLSQPTGNTWKYFTPSWGLQVGGGRQLSAHFAIPVEFDYDNFGLTGQTIANQLTLYNNQINYYCSLNPSTCSTNGVTDYASLDGNAHVWSFSIDPRYTFFDSKSEGFGAYALADVGFYHKVTNFTTPTESEECDYYGDCYDYSANQIVDHYTSNAPGFGAGVGVTYKFSHFSSQRFYAEARYVFVDNSQRYGVNVYSPVNSTTIAVANDFAPNSNRTTFIPIKFGIEF